MRLCKLTHRGVDGFTVGFNLCLALLDSSHLLVVATLEVTQLLQLFLLLFQSLLKGLLELSLTLLLLLRLCRLMLETKNMLLHIV